MLTVEQADRDRAAEIVRHAFPGCPGNSLVASGIKGGLHDASAVRRLTPEECEKLQGFLPGYTAVPYRNKPAADGPRYKSLGNSMAVPVMRWIGQRIQMVEDLTTLIERQAA